MVRVRATMTIYSSLLNSNFDDKISASLARKLLHGRTGKLSLLGDSKGVREVRQTRSEGNRGSKDSDHLTRRPGGPARPYTPTPTDSLPPIQ